MTPVLVTGATGTIGGAISRVLVRHGTRHRVFVRNPTAFAHAVPGVEVAIGDFAAMASLDAAMDGIEQVFLASFDRPEQIALQRNVLQAAKGAGVRHIVRMSTMGVDRKPHVSIFDAHLEGERQLEASGLDFTHLRPSWVMQNFYSFVVENRIRLPVGDGRVAFVDAEDIAGVAASALTKAGHAGKAYELTGPEAITHHEVAGLLSAATGRTIDFEDIPPDVYDQEKVATGWPRSSIDSLLALFAEIRAGKNDDATPNDTVARVTGRPARSFAEFAKEYAGSA